MVMASTAPEEIRVRSRLAATLAGAAVAVAAGVTTALAVAHDPGSNGIHDRPAHWVELQRLGPSRLAQVTYLTAEDVVGHQEPVTGDPDDGEGR